MAAPSKAAAARLTLGSTPVAGRQPRACRHEPRYPPTDAAIAPQSGHPRRTDPINASGSDTAATSPSRPDSAICVAARLPCSHPQKIKTTAVVLGRPSASPLNRGPANWPSARNMWIMTIRTAHFTMSPHMTVASSRRTAPLEPRHAAIPRRFASRIGSRRAFCCAALDRPSSNRDCHARRRWPAGRHGDKGRNNPESPQPMPIQVRPRWWRSVVASSLAGLSVPGSEHLLDLFGFPAGEVETLSDFPIPRVQSAVGE